MIERYMNAALVASRIEAFAGLVNCSSVGYTVTEASAILGIAPDPMRRIATVAFKAGIVNKLLAPDGKSMLWYSCENYDRQKKKQFQDAQSRRKQRNVEINARDVERRTAKRAKIEKARAVGKEALKTLYDGKPKAVYKRDRRVIPKDPWPIIRVTKLGTEPLGFKCRAVSSIFDLGRSL